MYYKKKIQKDAKALTIEVVKKTNNEINNTAKNAGNLISKGIKKIHF